MSTTVVEGAVKFEDTHAHDGRHAYLVPNEDPLLWRELLKGIPVQRAAGICSSGEVGLFAMLPSVRKELVLVDHSYRSLCVAMLKYVVMQQHGVDKARKLFTATDAKALKEALTKALEVLPPKVAEAYARLNDQDYTDLAFVKTQYKVERYYDEYYKYHRTRKTKEVVAENINNALSIEWKRTPKPLAAKAAQKLDKVKFVHGDFTDLVAQGPFDVFYMSNAHQHQSRNNKNPALEQVEAMVKPGGHVIACGGHGFAGAGGTINRARWNVVKTVKHVYKGGDHYRMAWEHTLYKLAAA